MFAVVRKSRKNRDLADDVFAVVCQNAPIAGPIVGIFVGTSKAATTRCQHDGADRHGDPHEQAARKIVQAYRCSWVASVNGTDRRQALAVCLPICRQADIGAWSLSLCHACPSARWSRRGAQAFEAGLDPSIKRKLDKQAAGNTFRVVAEELLKKLEREGRAPTTLVKLRWLLDFAFAAFGERPVAEITAPEILYVASRQAANTKRHAVCAARAGWYSDMQSRQRGPNVIHRPICAVLLQRRR